MQASRFLRLLWEGLVVGPLSILFKHLLWASAVLALLSVVLLGLGVAIDSDRDMSWLLFKVAGAGGITYPLLYALLVGIHGSLRVLGLEDELDGCKVKTSFPLLNLDGTQWGMVAQPVKKNGAEGIVIGFAIRVTNRSGGPVSLEFSYSIPLTIKGEKKELRLFYNDLNAIMLDVSEVSHRVPYPAELQHGETLDGNLALFIDTRIHATWGLPDFAAFARAGRGSPSLFIMDRVSGETKRFRPPIR